MADSSATEVCPICGVEIIGGRVVKFSSGPPGNRARLYARVCRFIQDERKTQCINQDSALIGEVTTRDSYGDGEDIQFPDFGKSAGPS